MAQSDEKNIGLGKPAGSISDLNERSREIFREVVEAYLETGAPIGSRTLSRTSPLNLSAASIRNVMADLEDLGLLAAPHTSAGRLPTQQGLRLFVDGLLEVGGLSAPERSKIESELSDQDRDLETRLTEATSLLSGLSHCAGLVVTPPQTNTPLDEPLRHVEFVHLGQGQALVVLVTQSGRVDNKIIDVPVGMPPAVLQQATNFVSARLSGRSLPAAKQVIEAEIQSRQAELDALAAKVIDAGLAEWVTPQAGDNQAPGTSGGTLIVRGQANLLNDEMAEQDIERVRQLFADLESKQAMMELLGLAQAGDGVRIFIGSENKLFSMSGSSVIVAPYRDQNEQIVGMVGVIGPTRLNYGRVIPIVDYTAQLIGKILD